MKKVNKNNKDDKKSFNTTFYDLDSNENVEQNEKSPSPPTNLGEVLHDVAQQSLSQATKRNELYSLDEQAVTELEAQYEKQAYLLDLQVKQTEEQLGLVKTLQWPQYNKKTGTLIVSGKEVKIPLNTYMAMVCSFVLTSKNAMKKKWSWDEIVYSDEDIANYSYRVVYMAARAINEKVASRTALADFLITKPVKTVQVNPKYLLK